MKRSNFEVACLSCLMHDLKVAFGCLQYHILNKYNPYSVRYREDLKVIRDSLDLLGRKIDSDVLE